MNKNRNKVAAMMMVAAITVSSVAMPVEAAVSSFESVCIERRKENINDENIEEVILNETTFPEKQLREYIKRKLSIEDNHVFTKKELESIDTIEIGKNGSRNPNNDFSSLDGVQYFPKLEEIYIYGCKNLKQIDLSSNRNLKSLTLVYCGLENINLKNNTLLETLSISPGNLTSLDLSNNGVLTYLDCSGNKLTKLILNGCNALNYIDISDNLIEEIDLSNKDNLKNIGAWRNKIEKVNLKNTNNIEELHLNDNNLQELDLSECKKLSVVDLSKNKLSYINVSNNERRVNLNIDENKIGYVEGSKNTEISNGNKQEIYIDINNNDKTLNLDTYFPGIDMNKVEVQTKGIIKSENNLKWGGNAPSRIRYEYLVGGKRDNQILNVHLILSTIDDGNPNPGGGSGGGTTTPDQKPDEKPNKPVNISARIMGKNRYETAAKIADELVKNNVSYNSVILVNSDKSMADGLSAASLSGKKNAPILLVKKDSIPTEAMSKIEKAKNVYIIGGEGAISKKVENQLKGKNITRISGKDRYETSAKIANMLGGYKMAFIVNGAKGEADAMSISSVAAKYGAPILLTNGKTSTHPVKEGVSYFVIGGRGVVSNQLADKYNADRIAGVDRYSTNRKVIDEFYYDSKKVYFAKGDTLVDALTASLLAKDNGMVLVSKNANHKKLEGKEAVQVGGMDFEISFE